MSHEQIGREFIGRMRTRQPCNVVYLRIGRTALPLGFLCLSLIIWFPVSLKSCHPNLFNFASTIWRKKKKYNMWLVVDEVPCLFSERHLPYHQWRHIQGVPVLWSHTPAGDSQRQDCGGPGGVRQPWLGCHSCRKGKRFFVPLWLRIRKIHIILLDLDAEYFSLDPNCFPWIRIRTFLGGFTFNKKCSLLLYGYGMMFDRRR